MRNSQVKQSATDVLLNVCNFQSLNTDQRHDLLAAMRREISENAETIRQLRLMLKMMREQLATL